MITPNVTRIKKLTKDVNPILRGELVKVLEKEFDWFEAFEVEVDWVWITPAVVVADEAATPKLAESADACTPTEIEVVETIALTALAVSVEDLAAVLVTAIADNKEE